MVDSLIAAGGSGMATSYSQGGQACVFTGCDIITRRDNSIINGSGVAWTFDTCRFYGRGSLANFGNLPSFNFTNCDFGGVHPLYTTTTGQAFLVTGGRNGVMSSVFTGCGVMPGWYLGAYTAASFDMDDTAPSTIFTFVNINGDPTQQFIGNNAGYVERDNSVLYRGTSSIRLNPRLAGKTHTYSIPFFTKNGVTYTVIGYVRKNSVYAGTTYPSLTVSGLGVAGTLTGSGTNTADTWEKITISFTQSSGADGNVSITFSTNTTDAGTVAAPALAYLDGVFVAPFVTSTRHYGYLFDTNVDRTVDPLATQTVEATVEGYTSISTLDDLYDELQLWACNHPALSLLHTTAGSTIDLGATNLVVDAAAEEAFSYDDGTLTINSTTLAAGTKFTKVQTTGTITTSGATISSLYQSNLGPSAQLVITLPLASMSVDVHNATVEVQYLAAQSGAYTLLIPPGATGVWTWAINKQGYVFSHGTFSPGAGGVFSYAPACPQIVASDGLPMYQGSTSALVQSTFSTPYSFIDIGNGTPSLQNVYDSFEDYLVTSPGMDWIVAGKDSISIFNSPGGDYLFMTGNIRLRRWHTTDANATIPAFAQSVDGTPVDEVNGPVRYLSSDTPTAVAAAVWSYMSRALTGVTSANITAVNGVTVKGTGTSIDPWNPA